MFAWLTHLISPTVWCIVCAKFRANELMVSFALFCVICDLHCRTGFLLVMVQYLCCFHWEAHDDLVVDLIRLHAVRFRFWDLFIWNLWISWKVCGIIWFAVCYLSCSVRYNHCWSCVWFVSFWFGCSVALVVLCDSMPIRWFVVDGYFVRLMFVDVCCLLADDWLRWGLCLTPRIWVTYCSDDSL